MLQIEKSRINGKSTSIYLLLLIVLILYALFFYYTDPVDFLTCKLCDGRQYLKLYWFFEKGIVSPISYPFYARPLVPFLASLIPGDSFDISFHIVNGFFMLLSLISLHALWNLLQIRNDLKWVGFAWLLLHWTGMIRYNIYDYVTVDVPLYFFQPLALILFFKKKFNWLYILTPVAMVQKESFLAIMVVFLIAHVLHTKGDWFKEGKHLVGSLILGVIIQKLIIWLMPAQLDERSSMQAILWHANYALEDPTRLIRWFAAFGSAFGLFPFLAIFKLSYHLRHTHEERTLILMSSMYCAFGLLAGEDMTRILFLGFPFIITLALISFQNESKWWLWLVLALSLVSLRMNTLSIHHSWSVDYASLDYVYTWATYYLVVLVLFLVIWIALRAKGSNFQL